MLSIRSGNVFISSPFLFRPHHYKKIASVYCPFSTVMLGRAGGAWGEGALCKAASLKASVKNSESPRTAKPPSEMTASPIGEGPWGPKNPK